MAKPLNSPDLNNLSDSLMRSFSPNLVRGGFRVIALPFSGKHTDIGIFINNLNELENLILGGEIIWWGR
jgi:hypothetical protein